LTHAAALIAGAMISVGMAAERAAAMPIGILVGTRSPNDKEVTYPIPASDGATIDKDNDVILARYQGKVYAFGLACPHPEHGPPLARARGPLPVSQAQVEVHT
jgi:hypothetical protein